MGETSLRESILTIVNKSAISLSLLKSSHPRESVPVMVLKHPEYPLNWKELQDALSLKAANLQFSRREGAIVTVLGIVSSLGRVCSSHRARLSLCQVLIPTSYVLARRAHYLQMTTT